MPRLLFAPLVGLLLCTGHVARQRAGRYVKMGMDRATPNVVTAHLTSPSVEPYALGGWEQAPKYNGQIGQDKWVDTVLKRGTGLFVIESGAFDGKSHSNSLFFEIARNYDCLLVEPNPHLRNTILGLHRKCHLLSGGLSITKEVSSFSFKLAGPLGGIDSDLHESSQSRIKNEIAQQKSWMKGEQGSGDVVQVQCFPLHLVMQALNRTTVDYWSLDTEGSEASILAATDFKSLEIGVITVEHNGDAAKRSDILRTLGAAGMERVVAGGQDDYYASRQYFQRRSLPFPGGGQE